MQRAIYCSLFSLVYSRYSRVYVRYCEYLYNICQGAVVSLLGIDYEASFAEHFALVVKGEIWQLFYTKSTGLFRILGRHLFASSCYQQRIYGKMHLDTHPFVHLEIGHKCRAKTIEGSKK